MNKVKHIVFLSVLFVSMQANANVGCIGKIKKVHKWNTENRISILLDTATNWIQMPTAADDAMALMAFAADKTVEIHWDVAGITSCDNGWAQHRPLEGWWWVLKN